MAQNEVRSFSEGSIICVQGDPADCLYILRNGRVGVIVNIEAKNPDLPAINRKGITVAELGETGSIVGEAGLFLKHRTASLKALSKCTELELIKLGQDGVRKLIENTPETGLTLCRSLAGRLRGISGRVRAASETIMAAHQAHNRLSISYLGLINQLLRAPFAAALDVILERAQDSAVYRAAYELQRQRRETNTVFNLELAEHQVGVLELEADAELCREGDIGKALYIVQEGELEVRISGRRVSLIQPGEMVGEVAILLSETPKRTASVKALCHTVLAGIEAADFTRVALNRPTLLVTLASTLSRRIESTNRMACDLDLGVQDDLDVLTGGAESCEGAFLQLARDLPQRQQGVEPFLKSAQEGAAEAVRARQEVAAAYDLIAHGDGKD